MKAAGAAALLLIAGCRGEAPQEPEGSSASVIIQSEDVVDGRRPELTLTCADGFGSFWLALGRTLEPGPAGAHGTIKVDDGAPLRLALTWLGEDRWAPRVGHDVETALVRAMVAGRNVYFSGPEGTTDRAYRWDLSRVGAGLEELRRRCG